MTLFAKCENLMKQPGGYGRRIQTVACKTYIPCKNQTGILLRTFVSILNAPEDR